MSAVVNLIKKNDTILYFATRVRQTYYKYIFSDEQMVKHIYRSHFGKEPNLINPQSFAEKIQWLKLNWYDKKACICADKYLVRDYVKKTIGEKYLNEMYGVYDNVSDIDIRLLPNQFVVKGTHGSHFNIICTDKKLLNWEKELNKLKRWSKINYYWQNREWVYKKLKSRFIIEKYLDDKSGSSLTDYKFFCFNGEPFFCQVIRNRGKNESIDFYDLEWNHQPFTGLRHLPVSDAKLDKPEGYDKMVKLARKLSKPFPFVRADFYNIHGNIIFGELTFFPQSGLGEFTPQKYDGIISKKLDLSTIKGKIK